jgi:hypothetical protein
MYQSLIWPGKLRYGPRGLSAPLDPEDRQGLTNPLVDRVRRDPELRGDLLGVEVLIDEAKTVELTTA